MAYRVIQFSTGNVGIHALRALIQRAEVELVGVHAPTVRQTAANAQRRRSA